MKLFQRIREWWLRHFPGIPHPVIRRCPSCGGTIVFRQVPHWHFGCTDCGYQEKVGR
jgi:hypothetical protein